MSNAVIIENFKSSKKLEYIRFVGNLGTEARFSDDRWICDKMRRSPAQEVTILTLRFNNIPEQHRDMVKIFSVICFLAIP